MRQLRQSEIQTPLGIAVSVRDGDVLGEVKRALDAGRVALAWQPIVSAQDAQTVMLYEGLIRVIEENGRIIPAAEFMGVVAQHELGRRIDCAALKMGLHALARHPQLRVSINMSARSLGYPAWMRILREGLAQRRDIGPRLVLEVSEESAILVPELVSAFMDEMQLCGLAFALDDFGAGLSSFRSLRDFSCEILKIDGQFIRNIHQDPSNQALVRSVIAVGRQFEMMTIAEAVETREEAEWLRAAGVSCLQGYGIGAPSLKPNWTGL